jgi:hypothetical protein
MHNEFVYIFLVHLLVNVIEFYKMHGTHCIKINDDKFRFGLLRVIFWGVARKITRNI